MKILFLILNLFLMTFAQDSDVIYSFKTGNDKTAELLFCETDSVFSYRFHSQSGNVELEISDDLKDSDTIFTVKNMYKGGRNWISLSSIYFSNNEFDYEIYYACAAHDEDKFYENGGEDVPATGIRVTKSGENIAEIRGKSILKGKDNIGNWTSFEYLPQVVNE